MSESGGRKRSNSAGRARSKSRDRRSDNGNKNNNNSSNHHNSHRSHQSNNTNNQSSGGFMDDFLRSIIKGAASSAGAKFTSSLGSNSNDNVQYGNPGEFDIYLFAQSWAPKFCCDKAAVCKQENMGSMDELATHGLWPAYMSAKKDGNTYPSNCSSKYTEFKKLKGRSKHEWEKHGTCTSLNPDQYFDQEIHLEEHPILSDLNDNLNANSGKSISVEEIYQSTGSAKNIAIMTNKYCQLLEITTCWSKNQDGTPGVLIECPSHLLGSSRNSAVLNGCKSVALEQSDNECQRISKDFLKVLKS